MRHALMGWLRDLGCEPTVVEDLRRLALQPPANSDMVCLGTGSASERSADLSLLRQLKKQRPDLPIVVISSNPDLDEAVEVMRAGASDYLARPVGRESFAASITRVFRHRPPVAQGHASRRFPEIVGESRAMQGILRHIERVQHSDIAVALMGETGTGKELVARAIHRAGARASGPFVAINCAAIPAALQEAELFGHERGAFTGATSSRPGSFEQAHRGTLFLDELGEMSPSTQAALLRVLQERSVRRVGGTSETPVDVRIISATSKDLEQEVAAGRFRSDLYYRLVVYPMSLPPLRERRQDIPALVKHMLEQMQSGRSKVLRVDPDAMDALVRYDWPGNVRELENVVKRSTVLCDGPDLQLCHLPSQVAELVLPDLPRVRDAAPAQGSGSNRKITPIRELERREILRALAATRGNVAKAAELLEIGRATLYRRISSQQIDVEEAAAQAPGDLVDAAD